MSLLTKEQKLTTDHIRAKLREDEGWGGRGGYESELLAIIDDLQARAPKQYTVHELRDWFKNRPLIQDEIDALLHEVVPGENEAWYSVLKFASHVGALKAEP